MREITQRAYGKRGSNDSSVELLFDSFFDELLGSQIGVLGDMLGEKFRSIFDFIRVLQGPRLM